MEWGWNPDTLVAVATVVAAAAAIVAGIFAAGSFSRMKDQIESGNLASKAAIDQAEAATQQLRSAQVRAERAQADSVAAWTESEGEGDEKKLVVVLRNDSSALVYDLRVAACLGTADDPDYRYALEAKMLPPTDAPTRLDARGASREHWPRWSARRPQNPHPVVEVVFRDASGNSWIRSADGNLAKYRSEKKFPDHWRNLAGDPIIQGTG